MADFNIEAYKKEINGVKLYNIEKIDANENPDEAKKTKQEMDNFIVLYEYLGKEILSYQIEDRDVGSWLKFHFGFEFKCVGYTLRFPYSEEEKKRQQAFYSLSISTSKQEIEKVKNSMVTLYLFFNISSEYIKEHQNRNKFAYNQIYSKEKDTIPSDNYHFVHINGDTLIKRQVFSSEFNIKRLYEINKELNIRQFVFSAISLDDFILGFWGIALKRYRNIEHMEFAKMKNFLRCSKCHATTKLDLENFINSSLNTVEAHYKCPNCGEVYSFSKLKKIYEENMRNAY